MTHTDNRRFERYDINRKIFYRTPPESAYNQGKTSNISKSGLLLESKGSITKGAEIELVINMGGTPVHFKGVCIYSLGGDLEGFHSGVKIMKINTAGMQLFLAFIKALEKKRREEDKSLRPETGDMDNVVQRMAGEHKLIIHYVVALQEMMSARLPYEAAEYEAILNLMQRDITTHFYIEEKIFFKTGLAHLPSKHHGLIGELNREHEEMRQGLDRIIEAVEGVARTNAPLNRTLKTAIKAFLEQLKEHARKEIVDLFPLMEANQVVKSKVLVTLNGAIKN